MALFYTATPDINRGDSKQRNSKQIKTITLRTMQRIFQSKSSTKDIHIHPALAPYRHILNKQRDSKHGLSC